MQQPPASSAAADAADAVAQLLAVGLAVEPYRPRPARRSVRHFIHTLAGNTVWSR